MRLIMPARRTPSEINIIGDVAEISLNGRNANGLCAIIDAADVQLVEGYSWSITGSSGHKWRYAISGMHCKRTTPLHRVIMNAQPGEFVDHIDHNTLDCRRSNLRICSPSENIMNRTKTVYPATSRYKGVYLRKDRWVARIAFNRRTICLGTFNTELAAAMAYDRAAMKYFGEFALLNLPGGSV
jgi:hypothetical protein